MTKYIKKKNIEYNKVNNIPDLSGVGKAAWNFIFTIYELGWDLLITNKENKTFRQQMVFKFTPKIPEARITSKSNKSTDKPVSFTKLPLPIFVKTPKKVMEISKFFKKDAKLIEKKDTRKSYS